MKSAIDFIASGLRDISERLGEIGEALSKPFVQEEIKRENPVHSTCLTERIYALKTKEISDLADEVGMLDHAIGQLSRKEGHGLKISGAYPINAAIESHIGEELVREWLDDFAKKAELSLRAIRDAKSKKLSEELYRFLDV